MSAREIPYAEFQAIEEAGGLEEGPIGDGMKDGHAFWIRRYLAPKTGKIYDVAFTSGVDKVPRVLEITPET